MGSIVYILVEHYDGRIPHKKNMEVYTSYDFATLKCAMRNALAPEKTHYYLNEVSLVDEDLSNDEGFFISRKNNIISIEKDDLEVAILIRPDYSLDLCGTDIRDLKLSEELIRALEHEASNYKDEKEE
jgi:hypothetical protein